MVWSGLGMNYGHQLSSSPYDISQAESDLSYLKSLGITYLRIAMPGSTDSSTIPYCKDLCLRALAKGFSVLWGVGPSASFDQSAWDTYLAYVPTLAQWAQDNGLTEFSIGNEAENRTSGTPSISTVQSNLRTLATTCQSIFTRGPISYSVADGYKANWYGNLGDLDKISVNVYDTSSAFRTACNAVYSNFGSQGEITEWSTTLGYLTYNDEEKWTKDVASRLEIIKNSGILRAYYFCYRANGNLGVTADKWNMILTDGNFRTAWNSLSTNNKRRFFVNI